MKTIRHWVAALLLTQILFVLQIAWSIWYKGVFPPPLYWDAHDSFMDFFHTNYWAFNEGRYEIWKSIYPIFTFFLARLLTNSECVVSLLGPLELRSCAAFDIVYLAIAYALGSLVCAWSAVRCFHDANNIRQWRLFASVFVIVLLSLPGVFALERGNYVIIAFMFLALAEYFNRDWKSALCLAVALSLKQYLIVLCLAPLLKRRYDYLLLVAAFVAVLNALAYLTIDETHFDLILENMGAFSTALDVGYFEKVWYSSSFSVWSKLVENSKHFHEYFSYSEMLWINISLTLIRFVGFGICLVSVILVARLSSVVTWSYVGFLALSILVFLVDSVGGYALLLLVPYWIQFVSDQIQRHDASKFPLLVPIVFLLLTPLDYVVGPGAVFKFHSFIGGRHVEYYNGITVGAYVRPTTIFVLMFCHLVYLCRRIGLEKIVFRTLGKNTCC